jgi:ClpP class serine protease
VVVTPGGMAGSIGVWTAHEDWSTYLEKKGIKVSLVSAGKFKVEGNPYGPLDDTAREAMQDVVNKYYGAFTSAVARNRGAENAKAVRDGYGEGRVLLAKDAVKEKIADRIGTFDQVIADVRTRLEKSRTGASRRAQAARVLRLTDANA